MTVAAGGYGTFSWRTYATCGSEPAPCDYTTGNELFAGGYAIFGLESKGQASASGRVFMTNESRDVPVGPVSLTYNQRDDTVSVSLANGQILALCGAKAVPPVVAKC